MILLALIPAVAFGLMIYFNLKTRRTIIAGTLNNKLFDWCHMAGNDAEFCRRVEFFLAWDIKTAFKLNGPNTLEEIIADYVPIY